MHQAGLVSQDALIAAGLGAVVTVGPQTLHLLADLNADQYAGEIRALLAVAPMERRPAAV